MYLCGVNAAKAIKQETCDKRCSPFAISVNIKNDKLIIRKTDNYAHLVHDETKLLCQYYEKTAQKDKIAPCIKGLHEALHAAEPCRGAMWYQSMLSQVQELYRKYHLYKEANRLYVDIQNCGERALQSMEEFRVEMRVSQEDIDGLW